MSVGYGYADPWPPAARLAQFTADRYNYARPSPPLGPAGGRPRPIRWRILAAAAQMSGEFTTTELSAQFAFAETTVLAALSAAAKQGLVSVRRETFHANFGRCYWRWLDSTAEE